MEEGQKKGKLFAKISKKKLILLVGFFFAIIILAIAGFFLLNKKEEEKGIKVGDTLITNEQISKNAKDMQSFLNNNKKMSYGEGSIEDIARNDLLVNAFFKSKQMKDICSKEVTVNNKNIYGLRNKPTSDSKVADNYVNDLVSNEGEYAKIRMENEFFERSFADCVLTRKILTRVSILSYGNYYLTLKDEDFKKEVNNARDFLDNKYTKLFKEKIKIEDLSNKVDYNTISNRTPDIAYFNKPNKVGLFSENWGGKYLTYKNPRNSKEATLLGGVNVNDYVEKLKEGEYTPAIIGSNGEVSIIRAEKVFGNYSSWEKFYKEKINGYRENNKISIDSPLNNISNSNATLSAEWSSACWNTFRSDIHNVRHRFTFRIGSGWYVDGGVTMRSSQTPGYFEGKGETCAVNDYGSLSPGQSIITLVMNCLGMGSRGTGYADLDISLPTGYKIKTVRYAGNTFNPEAEASYDRPLDDSYFGYYFIRGQNGLTYIDWDVYLEQEEHFQTDPQSYIKVGNKNERSYSQYWNRSNPLRVHLGDNVFFKHTNRMYDANKRFTISTSINRSISSDIGYGSRSEGPMDSKSLSYYNGETKTFEGSSLPSSGRYIVREEDIGKTVCQSITAVLGAKYISGGVDPSRTSNEVCFYVEPQPWQITASTQIGKNGSGFGTRHLNVNAGDSITWRHSFRNSTSYVAPGFPGNTIENNPHTYTNAGGQKAYGLTNKNQASSRATNDFQFRTNSGNIDPGLTKTTNDSRYTYRVQSSDLGTSLCQRAYATHSRDRGSPTVGEWLCAYVPYHFDITNCIKSPMDGNSSNCSSGEIPVEPGDDVPIIPKVPNKGTRTPRNTKWKITQWEVDGVDEEIPVPTNPVDNRNGNTASHYNEQFRGKGKRFSVKEGEREFQVGENTLQDILRNIKIPDNAPLGQRYCVAVSISAPTMLENETQEEQQAKVGRDWRHSQPLCMLVTKKPKMQVWGNGLYSRGGVVTSVSRGLGSWVEYEALVGGQVKGFKSESSQTTRNLTIDNFVNGAGSFGQGASSINAIRNSLNTKFPRSDGNEVRVDEGVGTFSGVDYRRGGSPIRTHIIKGRDIVINGDIFVRNPIGTNGIKQFQQIIMIAEGNIYIQGNVGNIDAWLIATGDIYTCANGATTGHGHVNQKNCGKHLAVNGPVLTNNLHSWRTYGSENKAGMDRSTPAETYNQRADIYMWAQAQASGNGKMLTTFSKELPVRY